MKISESVIEKLQLVLTNTQTGNSFINNLLIYKSSLPDFKDYFFMECDLLGMPCRDISIVKKGSKNRIEIAEDFINSMPLETLKNVIIE